MLASRRWSRSCRRTDASELFVVGALADVVEDQFARLFAAMGIEPVRFLPPRRASTLRRSDRERGFCLAQPFLAETARALEARGARRIAAPFPLGVEGTTLWLQAAASAFGVAPSAFDAATSLPRERGRRAVAPLSIRTWRGSAMFLFPDFAAGNPACAFR